MKIKHLIIICVVLLVVLMGIMFFVLNNSKNNVTTVNGDEESFDVTDEEVDEGETISVTFINKTGLTIKELFLYEEAEAQDDELTGYEQLGNKKLDDGEEIDIDITGVKEGAQWDIGIKTEDGSYELNELLTTDFVFEGSTLCLFINEDKLDFDFEDVYEENQNNQEEYEERDEEENQEENQDYREENEEREDEENEERREEEQEENNNEENEEYEEEDEDEE